MLAETRDPVIPNRFALLTAKDIGGPLDFRGAMRSQTHFLFGEHGGFIFEWTAPRTFEVHVMLAPEGRGSWGFSAAREGLRFMATRADRLWARIAPENRPLALYAAITGFRKVESRRLWNGEGETMFDIYERDLTCLQQ